ncbi:MULTISPECIES: SpoIIE family protein phosphatase [unclassified Isoptericola]|uniref:SpoIIE family protein phosphatase n=1 Tax=unclassified Isoptericola TaxID=2623355 RepID=UPI002713EC09|nr:MULTISPECIES: SpoIIE family protein phosphatase [unclassified Isoptericola]MDO8149759.1 SpoIIE family protein phosphatase [Isoptericola sp. b515]MDO8152056.1 SpoIIE family protein phosphatase [Isoptericola sp. b408]
MIEENGRRRVLVVDDTHAHRYLMATWLRAAGYAVAEAATGSEALQRASAEFDTVVLDVNLPDVSGAEVCRELKNRPETSPVPVLHVSATSIDAAARTAGLQHGADAYLPEPLDRDEFLATVGALCRSYDEKRGAHRTAQRLDDLGTALVPLHSARSAEEAVDLAARGASSVLGRAAIAMVVVDADHVLRTVCPAPGAPLVRGAGETPVPPPGGVSSALLPRERVPAPWRELLTQAGVGPSSWWTTWMRDARGRLVGGLGVQLADSETGPTDDDRETVRRFTQATAVALANLRLLAEEHRITRALQDALLPSDLTVRPGFDVSACYEASDDLLDVGGDFYDAFDLPDGRVAVVIGDVQGHSLHAATVMGELRLTLRAYLREGHGAERALELLNEVLRTDHTETATVCVCLADPVTGEVELTDAGHLPAMLVRSDGTARPVKSTSRLLGLPSPESRPPYRTTLAVGDLLVLATDGLVERRDGSLRDGLARLRTAAAQIPGTCPDDACQHLLDAFDDGAREDDVAVVIVRRTSGAAQ